MGDACRSRLEVVDEDLIAIVLQVVHPDERASCKALPGQTFKTFKQPMPERPQLLAFLPRHLCFLGLAGLHA